jgi:hypothetical protein
LDQPLEAAESIDCYNIENSGKSFYASFLRRGKKGRNEMIVQAVANIPMQGWKTQKTGQPTTCSYLTGLMTPLHFPVQTIEELQQPNGIEFIFDK